MQQDIFTTLEQILRSARLLHTQGNKEQSQLLLDSMRQIIDRDKSKPNSNTIDLDRVKSLPMREAKR